ncbi:hypothetical protein JIN84_10815 [Luteolibacter yonseiensis]|uniref:Uncharacterized protein n=1 Tax=Luteolibacter yonseiensis TaxID=1144680 RepID=A0A934R3B1_9BACT|nr:hypothetical protein [Luteolibacter yonseiensis]MBK1816104.1 hypothetical protein [Luteolibacter yonseiensis]
MKTPIILASLSAVGLLSGYGVRRLASENSPATGRQTSLSAEAAPVNASTADVPGRPEKTISAGKPTLPEISVTRSTDTVASILALDPAKNYARIALWTGSASEGDLAEYWAGYKGGKRSVDVTDLIFLNWTRRNPQAAVAAVAGTGDDRYAWWSWAANDPQAALTASLSAGKGQQEQVACGIGDFNPDWLRTHLGQIPEEFRDDAFNRMRNWPDGQNPLESLKFMKENGMGFDHETFKSLVRKDPWTALDYLKENPAAGRQMYSSDNEAMTALVSILSQERPEDLERLAVQTPPGEAKRKMEQALFDRLLETDPAAALDQARETEAPLIAAQRMAKVALGVAATNPEKAFQIAGEILKANPVQLDIQRRIETANGSSWSVEAGAATELLNVLFSKDREKVLKLMDESCGDQKRPEVLYEYSGKWAESDLAGFTEWTNQQTGRLRGIAAQQIGNKLAGQGSYEEAIEWAATGTLPPEQAYTNILYQWSKTDSAAAAAWLDGSSLTDKQKNDYRSFLKNFPR